MKNKIKANSNENKVQTKAKSNSKQSQTRIKKLVKGRQAMKVRQNESKIRVVKARQKMLNAKQK